MWKKIQTARPLSRMLARKMMRYSTGRTMVVNSLCAVLPSEPAVALGALLLSGLRRSSARIGENNRFRVHF